MIDPFALNALAFHEPWRLWTGHLAHFGFRHALLNLAALAIPLMLVGRRERTRLIAALALAAPLLSVGILWQLQDGSYRGASGLACMAWALVGVMNAARRDFRLPGFLLLATLAAKIAFESVVGPSLFHSGQAWRALPAAHTLGAGLGLLTAAMLLVFDAVRRPDSWKSSSPGPGAIPQ